MSGAGGVRLSTGGAGERSRPASGGAQCGAGVRRERGTRMSGCGWAASKWESRTDGHKISLSKKYIFETCHIITFRIKVTQPAAEVWYLPSQVQPQYSINMFWNLWIVQAHGFTTCVQAGQQQTHCWLLLWSLFKPGTEVFSGDPLTYDKPN